jgi:hypothetical protein
VLPVKSLSSVALAGSLVLRKYFGSARKIIEPWSQLQRLFEGPGFFDHQIIWRAVMPKAAQIQSSIRLSTSENSDRAQFISVALFSGIGLLISLVAVIKGVQGVWY